MDQCVVFSNSLTKFERSHFEKLFATVPVFKRTNVMREISPQLYVCSNLPPTICLHGLAKSVVSPEDSRLFAEKMKLAGNRYDLVLRPETSHAFLTPNYKCSKATVVYALFNGDNFLTSLGWFSGEPKLVASDPPSVISKWHQ